MEGRHTKEQQRACIRRRERQERANGEVILVVDDEVSLRLLTRDTLESFGYDTEKRLEAQGLAPDFSIESLVIEAGPTFFDGAVKKVGDGIASELAQLSQRNAAPYVSNPK